MLAISRSLFLLCIFIFSGSLGLSCGWVSAQENKQAFENDQDVRQVRFGISGGIRKMTPGHWGVMRTEVSNPSDQDREALSIIYFDVDPGIQFGRRIWVPANSSRVFWIPVLIPENVIEDEEQRSEFVTATARMMLLDESGEQERVLRPEGQQLATQIPFSVDNTGKSITAQISNLSNSSIRVFGGLTEDQAFGSMLKTMRISRGLGESVPKLNDPRVPIVPALLGAADQLVIRGNQLANDAPGRTAIRQWVQQGGRLWVMLDSMDEETCQRLLGDSFGIEYVDRVGLVKFQSKLANQKPTPKRKRSSAVVPRVQEHDQPVDFVRAIVDDCDTIATIDGWPSIFKKDFGHGTILFTTIGHRSFVRERRRGENPRGMENAVLLPQPELKAVADILFAEEKEPIVSASTLEPLIERGIGYQVPGRGLILIVLFGFCIGLTLVGIWLSRINRLGNLIWVVPATTLLATIPLIVFGNMTQQAIQPTVVEAQFVEVPLSGDDLAVQGLAGVFDNQSGPRQFASDSTSLFFPDRTGISGTWRMVWRDLDNWQWENVSMPSGLRHVPFSATVPATDPYRVYGTFGAKGFVGEFESPLTNVRDAIVASSTHVSLAVDIDEGSLSETIGGTLDPGNYMASSLLTDEQISHQKVYRNMMDFGLGRGINVEADADAEDEQVVTYPTHKYPREPSLMAWADPIDLGFDFGEEMQRKGAALVVTPIQLQRPEANKSIRIPSVFLPYDSVPGPNDEGISVAFVPELGIWPKRSLKTKSTLRFQLPQCVLPFQPSSAKLRIKINAAKRAFDVKSGRVQSLVDVGSTNEALGVLTYQITDPKALELDENGGLHVRISVGEPDAGSAEQKREWKIDFMDLELEGTYSPKN